MSLTAIATTIANLMIDAANGLASPLELLLLITLFNIEISFYSGMLTLLSSAVNGLTTKLASKQAKN